MAVTHSHDEKETLSVDVIIPEHAERTTTPLFRHTREQLLARDGARCWICQRTEKESGHPLQAHHWVIERCLAEMIDFDLVRKDCEGGLWGEPGLDFDWSNFDAAKDPYAFVDNMLVNGRLLCVDHHIGKNEGIHQLPWPLYLAQRYGKEGYKFSSVETIHHEML